MKTQFSAILLTFLLITGSAWAEDEPKTTGEPPQSGFLGNFYLKLQASPDYEGLWTYIDKSKDYKGYTKVMFEIEIYNNPNVGSDETPPRVLYQMRSDILASLSGALAPVYEIVHEPGPDVLRFRICIAGVRLVDPPTSLTDYIPVKAAFDMVMTVTGNANKAAQMTAEMEVLNAGGHRLAALVVARKGDKSLTRGDKIAWAEVQPIVDYWAKGLRQGLDQLRAAGHSDVPAAP